MARRWSALGAAAAACALAGAASGGDAGPTISPVVFVGEEATGNAAGLTVGGTLFEMSRVTIDEAGLVSFQAADMATGTRFTARALPGLVQGLLRTGQVIATADGDFEVIDDGAGLETRGHSAEGRMYFRRTLRAVNNASDVRTALLRTSGSSVFTAMLPVESIGAGAGLMVADVITPPRVNREDEAAVVALGMDGAGGVREVLLVVDGIERRVIALEATGAPGLPGFAPFEAFGEVALPALADDGRIFFEARVGGAGNGDSALFTHWNGLLTFIAAPMRTTVDGLLVTGGFEALSMGDDGRIAFVCTLLSPFGELRAIVTGAPDDLGLYDDLQIAALDGQGVMDDGMQIEIDLDDVNGDAAGRMRMNAAGVIAMRVRWREPGGMESLGDAMLRWRDGALAIAARSGDALEDGSGAVISAIGEATLGSSAQILFDVETQSARGASGTAVVVAFEGTTAVQLRSGDVLEDLDGVLRQAAEVRVPVGANPAVEDGDVMSEQGRFPVRVRFTDGAEAVYVVLPQSGCPSDINGDGIVNAGDLATLLNDWGSSFPQSDISGDGVVNAADLASLLNDWGVCK